MRVGVIRNPVSGRGRGAAAWNKAALSLRSRFPDLTELHTTGNDSAKSQTEELIASGCELVIAAGGDGTVCGVLQGLVGTGAALAVMPFGTGNDFSRTLGIGTDMERAIDAIFENRRLPVDVGRWEQVNRSGYFLNVAGCGFDACVADRINSGFRRLSGRPAYLAAILATLRKFEPFDLQITIDGADRVSERAMMCAVANAKSYGGGLLIAPSASLTDGLLDLVLVKAMSRGEFLTNFLKVLKGTHIGHPKVQTWRSRHMRLDSGPATPFLIDGELLPAKATTFEVMADRLEVVVP